jgi:hypothetical protein
VLTQPLAKTVPSCAIGRANAVDQDDVKIVSGMRVHQAVDGLGLRMGRVGRYPDMCASRQDQPASHRANDFADSGQASPGHLSDLP